MNIEELLHLYTKSPEVLANTPKRFAKALKEMLDGYAHDISSILSVQFEQDEDASVYNGIVCLTDVSFVSVCEHHLLPFHGTATVAYKINHQNPRIVGLSKLARLVEAYSKRLQVQERLCQEIADSLAYYLEAEGSFCLIKSEHSCMKYRGVNKNGSSMITSSETGWFKEEANRAYLFSVLSIARRNNEF